MNSEWRIAKLGDVAKCRNGAGIKQDYFSALGTPLARISDFTEDSIDLHNCIYVDLEEAENWQTHRLNTGDVLVATVGSWPPNWSSVVGKTVRVPSNAAGAIQNQNTACILANPILADQRFLYFLLRSKDFVYYAANAAGGSANQARLAVANLEKFSFNLPPLDEQRAIAHILGTLDDKIELNQQMNHTLESIARALFKSWFIDFDPVRAKMDGRQPIGIDAETATLFPDEFEDSAIGQIPKGWQVRTLGDFIDIKHGYAFKGEFFRDKPPGDILLTPGNFAIGGGFKDDKFKYYVGEVPEEFVLAKGDLLVTMTDLSKLGDTLGYPAILPTEHEGRYLHNQRLGKLLIKSGNAISKLYLYYLLRTNEYRHEILAGATGTTVKHTSPGRIQAFKFFAPPPELSQKFETIVGSLVEKKTLNDDENHLLAITRDSLLPKLLAGDIPVRNFEGFLIKEDNA